MLSEACPTVESYAPNLDYGVRVSYCRSLLLAFLCDNPDDRRWLLYRMRSAIRREASIVLLSDQTSMSERYLRFISAP